MRVAVFRASRRVARLLGYDLVPRTIYTPIPELPAAGAEIWTRPPALVGLELDPAKHLEFLRAELKPFLSEFDPPSRPQSEEGFHLWNGYYQSVDAEVLYAMVRYLRPRRVLELGSGYSTLVTAAACLRNAAEGTSAEFTAVDPTPRIPVSSPGLTRLERSRAEELPLEHFLELEERDVLFVDSSHVVKLGGEVNFLVLEVLPRLRPGVAVHFHDVFWPYEYPRAWYVRGTYATEQYLLQAFLLGNRDYEILFAAHAVARAHRAELEDVIPSLRERADHHPAALWLRRRPVEGGSRRVERGP